MSGWSRYDKMRRRLAPVAFLGALVFLGTRTCGSEMAKVELWFDVGSNTASLTSLQVEITRQKEPGEVIAHFEHNFHNASASLQPRWKLQLDPGMYDLALTVRGKGGVVRVRRVARAVDNAVIRVSLSAEVARASTLSRPTGPAGQPEAGAPRQNMGAQPVGRAGDAVSPPSK